MVYLYGFALHFTLFCSAVDAMGSSIQLAAFKVASKSTPSVLNVLPNGEKIVLG